MDTTEKNKLRMKLFSKAEQILREAHKEDFNKIYHALLAENGLAPSGKVTADLVERYLGGLNNG
jgi:hypothetical protein